MIHAAKNNSTIWHPITDSNHRIDLSSYMTWWHSFHNIPLDTQKKISDLMEEKTHNAIYYNNRRVVNLKSIDDSYRTYVIYHDDINNENYILIYLQNQLKPIKCREATEWHKWFWYQLLEDWKTMLVWFFEDNKPIECKFLYRKNFINKREHPNYLTFTIKEEEEKNINNNNFDENPINSTSLKNRFKDEEDDTRLDFSPWGNNYS